MGKFRRWRKSRETKASLAVLITAALLIETVAAIQYAFTAGGIRREAQNRAEAELRQTSLHIRNVTTAVEVAAANMVWAIEHTLDQPDSIYNVSRRLVNQNSMIVGCGVCFIPDYYPQKGRWFEPYVAKRDDGFIEQMQIGSASHDYLNAKWFKTGMEAGEQGVWTEPYYDDAGARMMLCTYTLPVHDKQGRVVAVMGADVSLDWLSTVINSHPIYPSSYNLMLSREGQIIACPVESLVLQRSVFEVASEINDTNASVISRMMVAGERGVQKAVGNDGKEKSVFFAPIEGNSGWSMAVVCTDDEIYASLHRLGLGLTLLTIFGMALMVFIMFRIIHGFNRLREINAEKERMGSELRIANAIQMGMLPKTFPPFPDRDDVEILGSLVPAKEVGGDLYDFFIRDEKLFFCVGDVSGKGVPASLVMAVTRSLFRSESMHESNPGRIIEAMNRAMSEINDNNMFVTMFVGVLDLPTGRIHYCNAGHCAPVLLGASVGMLPVVTNIPVGLVGEWKFVTQEAVISTHTLIFLYTDGLTEAENPQHELFGEQRMLDVAKNACSEKHPTDIIQRRQEAVSQFVDGAEQSDDLTMLMVQFTKEQRQERFSRSITLPNDVEAVPRLSAFVERVAEELQFDPTATMNLNLAVEEAVVNVMNYAYPEGIKGNINIEACANDSRLKFTITDNGIPFDPTAVRDADVTLSVDQRPVGGLGIYLIRQLMDSINYEYVDGHNILTLRKKLTP